MGLLAGVTQRKAVGVGLRVRVRFMTTTKRISGLSYGGARATGDKEVQHGY